MIQKHTHKYIRCKYGSKGYMIFKCALPGCTHYVDANLILNRLSVCWRCGADFVIKVTPGNKAVNKKPHCNECTRGYKKQIKEQLVGLIEHFQKILETNK